MFRDSFIVCDGFESPIRHSGMGSLVFYSVYSHDMHVESTSCEGCLESTEYLLPRLCTRQHKPVLYTRAGVRYDYRLICDFEDDRMRLRNK